MEAVGKTWATEMENIQREAEQFRRQLETVTGQGAIDGSRGE